jgi:hypothetical protein
MNALLGIARDVRASRRAPRGKVRENPTERKTFFFLYLRVERPRQRARVRDRRATRALEAMSA